MMVIEDTQYSRDDIERLFGESVALLVEGMTKIDIIEMRNWNLHPSDKGDLINPPGPLKPLRKRNGLNWPLQIGKGIVEEVS